MNFAILSTLLAVVSAASKPTTHVFNWTLGWKTVNPDGEKDRLVVSINDEWPLPIVRVNQGDRIIANVYNGLESPARDSSIHFHGMFQNGTADMDGPPMLAQCPSAPGTSFTYNFTVDQPGTYWYHAHTLDLYPDGYRQLFLVENDNAWFQEKVDEEIGITLSDWYHEVTAKISKEKFMNLYNPTGAEPVPNNILFNDTLSPRWKIQPNKTYRLRLANIGAFSGFYFYMPNHTFTIVEVDGVYTEPAEADLIYISTAQRYSILFNTSSAEDEVYQMVQVADLSMFDIVPPNLQLNRTGFLYTGNPSEDKFFDADNQYIFDTAPLTQVDDDSTDEQEELSPDTFTSENLAWFDDMELVPHDRMELFEPVTVNHTLTVTMSDLLSGTPYAFFNDITYTKPKVPSLFSALSAPSDEVANNETIYGFNTQPIVLQQHDVVQIILNNNDDSKHPFHLHGHNFQSVYRAPGMEEYTPYDPAKDPGTYSKHPVRRDTLVVLPNSHFLIRFRADNPGVWIFHCHVDWHLTQGLAMQFIEAPTQIRQNYKVHPLSSKHSDLCGAAGIKMTGNAAANNVSFFDLTGQNVQEKWLPSSFTLRGYVALFFSIVSAFVGMGFLCWYGSTDTAQAEDLEAERIIEDTLDNTVDDESREPVERGSLDE